MTEETKKTRKSQDTFVTALRITQFRTPDGKIIPDDVRSRMIDDMRNAQDSDTEGKLRAAIDALVPVLPECLPTSDNNTLSDVSRLTQEAKKILLSDSKYDKTYWVPIRVYEKHFKPEIVTRTTIEGSI